MRPMPPSHLPLLAAWLLTVLPALATAKIVFLNGTEVFRVGNGTTPPPIKWFQPRNISNHSGAKTEAVIRKSDAEEQVEEQRLEAPLATRSGRQLGLFSMQRFLNGLHILALLAGIYLMIFVVEPVAVPQHYLSQHYFGLPWSSERRVHTHLPPLALHDDRPLQVISAKVDVERENRPFVLDKSSHRANEKKNLTNRYNLHKDTFHYSPYRFLLSNYTQDKESFANVRKFSTLLQDPGSSLNATKNALNQWSAIRHRNPQSSIGDIRKLSESTFRNASIKNATIETKEVKRNNIRPIGIVETVKSPELYIGSGRK